MQRCVNCPHKNEECVAEQQKECNVTREELKKQIIDTLKTLYSNEKELIEVSVNEVCITSYFWYYFKNKYQELYSEMNIDPEYNRNDIDSKYYYIQNSEELRKAKPDMLIHKRKCNKHNYAYLEFKKTNTGIKHDYQKLKSFTSEELILEDDMQRYMYKYRYGISILLDLEYEKIIFKWFEKGRLVHEEAYNSVSWIPEI